MILYGLFLSVVGVIGTLLFLDFLYQCAIALSYVRKANPLPRADARLRFAVLVPAHNEESVIVPLLESLKAQTHPSDLTDIYVSCDDCADATAALARERGAKVLIRRDPDRRGKTWNVRWALAHIPLDGVDAVAIFDADNLAAPDFLSKMNDFLADPSKELRVAFPSYPDLKERGLGSFLHDPAKADPAKVFLN